MKPLTTFRFLVSSCLELLFVSNLLLIVLTDVNKVVGHERIEKQEKYRCKENDDNVLADRNDYKINEPGKNNNNFIE